MLNFSPEVLTKDFIKFIVGMIPLIKGGGVMSLPARGASFELEKRTHSESLSP
jgi:hypothetical protein